MAEQAGLRDWWTGEDCAAFVGVKPETWRWYVARRLPASCPAPPPTRRFGVTPVWDPDVVRAWQAARPGRGWWRTAEPSPTS